MKLTPAHATLLTSILEQPDAPRVVVIGAAAILHHVPLKRFTDDLDLAIVADERAVNELLASANWERDQKALQRWRAPDGNAIVDALPASPEIIEAGSVRLDGDDKEMSMVGFDLAIADTVERTERGLTLEVATLPALVLLKIVAWLDRPHVRTKDLGDIGRMLDGALEEWDERRWDSPLATLSHDVQSAFFLGGQLSAKLRELHRAKIDEFFALMHTESWCAVMAKEAGWVGADPESMARRKLDAFRDGLSST